MKIKVVCQLKLWILRKKIKKIANSREKTTEKRCSLKLICTFDGRQRVLDAFQSKIFPIKIEGTGFSDTAGVAMAFDCMQEKASDKS